MAKTRTPIPPSKVLYENTGVFTWKGAGEYKVIGYNIETNKAYVKSLSTGEQGEMTNQQIDRVAVK